MHEMSLCSGLREIIEEQPRLQHFSRVLRVRLEMGALAGVESAALRFGFAVIMHHTLVQGAALKIIALPGQAWCPDCAQPIRIQRWFAPCPRCGGYALQVKGGDELRIKDLEVE